MSALTHNPYRRKRLCLEEIRPKEQRPKWSLNDLDDYCLSKIIAKVINSSSGETSRIERNLSLVNKRFYMLTQTLIGQYGCHKLELSKGTDGLKLFRSLHPKLIKYKHIQISGSMDTEQFVKLLQIMNVAKVEKLDLLDVSLESDPNLGNNSLLQRWKSEQKLVLNLHWRDQKYLEPEVKVRYLIQWSRLADLTVNISAMQKITIDCCHLMWLTGRSLRDSKDANCNIVFKISLRAQALRPAIMNPTATPRAGKLLRELTVPFGKGPRYELNESLESSGSHREILRAISKGNYFDFVKSVRES